MKPLDRWLLSILILLFSSRIILLFFGLYFCSIYIEIYFWFLLSLFGITIWFFRLKTVLWKGLFILFSFIAYVLVWIVVMYMTWLINGHVDDVKAEKFKGLEQKVWMQFRQGSWGGRPYNTITLGNDYFWGLMYVEEVQFESEIGFEDPNISESDKYEIPSEVKQPEYCVFWKERGWLFDFNRKTCYKLKKRKPIKLSINELNWLKAQEKELNASIYLGKGFSDIKGLYEKPTTIYLTINYRDTNFVKTLSNAEVEQLTSKFAQSLSEIIEDKGHFKKIDVHFVNYDNREIYEFSFDYNKDFKYAVYDIDKQKVETNILGVDYIKRLYIPWTKFLCIDYDGRNKSEEPYSHSLGLEMHHINDIGNVLPKGKVIYKGLECEVYEGNNPKKIKLKNGYLVNSFRYTLFEEEAVDITITYDCYPTNKKFTYAEVVNKITFNEKADKPEKMFYKYVDKSYLNFYYETEESVISCIADTTHIPWRIKYTTSISQPHFLYLYK